MSPIVMRARAEAHLYLLQYWELLNRYTQFTRGGKLPGLPAVTNVREQRSWWKANLTR